MAISHADHNHPNTPAARAACRKLRSVMEAGTAFAPAFTQPAKVTVVPRTRGDGGVVKGMKESRAFRNGQARMQKVDPKNVKRTNTLIKNDSDMADVPRALAHGIREAWARDLDVRVGDRFRHDEARVVIQAELGEIALVWKDSNMHGVNAIFVRNYDSSKTFKVSSIAEAFTVTEDRDLWDEFGNLRTA